MFHISILLLLSIFTFGLCDVAPGPEPQIWPKTMQRKQLMTFITGFVEESFYTMWCLSDRSPWSWNTTLNLQDQKVVHLSRQFVVWSPLLTNHFSSKKGHVCDEIAGMRTVFEQDWPELIPSPKWYNKCARHVGCCYFFKCRQDERYWGCEKCMFVGPVKRESIRARRIRTGVQRVETVRFGGIVVSK